jgi:hypothetical protein
MVLMMSAGMVLGGAVAAAQGTANWDTELGDPLHIWVGNPDAAKARAWSPISTMKRPAYLMGKTTRSQGTLFPVVLDDLIPADHVCRVLDA